MVVEKGSRHFPVIGSPAQATGLEEEGIDPRRGNCQRRSQEPPPCNSGIIRI